MNYESDWQVILAKSLQADIFEPREIDLAELEMFTWSVDIPGIPHVSFVHYLVLTGKSSLLAYLCEKYQLENLHLEKLSGPPLLLLLVQLLGWLLQFWECFQFL